jgi:hypothetical protein
MNYETSAEIEIAIARYFDVRKNIIVPNVSHGMFGYELDLCIVSITGRYATEVEIKISKADLKADSKKRHRHDWNDNFIKNLYFAMPEKMIGYENLVPEKAGIIFVTPKGKVYIFRKCKPNKLAKKWDDHKLYKLTRLGMFRVWNMKEKIWDLQMQIKNFREKLK